LTKLEFHLGKLKIDAPAYGSQGNAILGIRDSGKTYTATEIAEKLFEAGIPFTTFDPTGVWRFLRVPGAGRGYPVVVAGGKEGDLPLTVAGAPEIVRAAMKNGVSIVLDLTDQNLSKADWKRIVKSCVRVMLSENAQHGLRHVFIEEAAEFIPQRVIDGDVYAEVEKLARIGGNSRLGYTLINQRSQEVSKAVLELCENLFLHRQKGKNALDSLAKWFDLAEVAERKEIMRSLPNLPSGQCCDQIANWRTANSDRYIGYSRKNYRKYEVERREYARARYSADPIRCQEEQRRRRLKNPVAVRAIRKASRIKNKELYIEKSRRWKSANYEKVLAFNRNYRARRRAAQGTHTADDVRSILRMQRFRCAYCPTRLPDGVERHVDHITALTRGGTNDRRNLQILCQPCNSRKYNHDPIDFAQSLGLLL
jgi:5-methylcytosine-specific restriction endonuclease McrA